MPERDRPPNYQELLELAKAAEHIAEREWSDKGYRDEYEIEYMILTDLGRRDMLLSKAHLRNQLGEPIESPVYGPFFPTRLVPNDFYKRDFPWNTYTVPSDVCAGLADSIQFEMIVPVITRRWFSADLLCARTWKWKHSTPEDPFAGYPLSTGGKDPEGHLIAFPGAMVFLRNVRITNARIDLVQTGSTLLRLGPFAFHERHIDRAERSLNIDTMQLATMLTSKLAKSPHPDWNLPWQTQGNANTRNHERV